MLNESDDARHYCELAQKINHAFTDRFLDASTHQYGSGSQTSNAVPLCFGMVPAEHVPHVLKNLIDEIRIAHHGHLSTGILGTNALADTLADHGAADVMYDVVNQTGFPGWADQVAAGATTLWETWEGHPEFSFNMKMFGSCDKFFFKHLAGIRPAAPGYRKLHFSPQIVGDLTSASASINTIAGRAMIAWRKTNSGLVMEVDVPANTTARVSVPKSPGADTTIKESGEPLWDSGAFVNGFPGIDAARDTGDAITFDVRSGAYHFQRLDRSD